jgi:hypothetical protein
MQHIRPSPRQSCGLFEIPKTEGEAEAAVKKLLISMLLLGGLLHPLLAHAGAALLMEEPYGPFGGAVPILAGPECTNNPAEELPEPYDHAQNLTGTLPIELAAKSLILRVYDVLMNDTG